MLRWLGFILIVSGTSSAGIALAAKIKKNISLCRSAMQAVAFIRSEIEFYLTPLDQILEHLTQQLPSPLGGCFEEMSLHMKENPSNSPGLVFKKCAETGKVKLPRELNAILCDTFTYLGRQDILAQTRALDAAARRIDDEVQRLERERAEKGRMYKTIGVCAGVAIAILLI